MEKAHKPTIKNTKNVPSTMRVIYLVTSVIYLIHDHLDLAIVCYTIVQICSFRFGQPNLNDLFFQFHRLIWLHNRLINWITRSFRFFRLNLDTRSFKFGYPKSKRFFFKIWYTILQIWLNGFFQDFLYTIFQIWLP